MPEVSLRIPQIGEGLKEARLVAVLKQPGDSVKRDEPIYQMETDKAVMDVESPHEGKIVKWLAEADTVLPIGAEVLVMEVGVDGGREPGAGSQESGVGSREPGVGSQGSGVGSQVPGVGSRESDAGKAGEVALTIPQIGEGLQEARLVAHLKRPGEAVKRDEPIYQMETDKAVMDVESPYDGVLVKWLAEPDTVLAIGAEVAVMRTAAAPEGEGPGEGERTREPRPKGEGGPQPAGQGQRPREPQTATGRRMDVPPRTRAYAKSKGLSDPDIERIAASGSKLMPEDVDAFLAGGSASPFGHGSREPFDRPRAGSSPSLVAGQGYSEQPMAPKQRNLMSRLMRGNQVAVPGTMTVAMDWGPVETLRAEFKAKGGEFQPSAFTMFAFAAALATKDHPMFRSTVVGDGVIRTYDHIHLGIAVALPGDELVIAVVDDADTMDWRTFAEACRERVDLARGGKDQANESVTLSLTNMQAHGIRDAVAVVVPPGIATVFLGEPYNGLAQHTSELKLQRCANLGITFDHRLINGVGAAQFQNAVKANVEGIRDLVKP